MKRLTSVIATQLDVPSDQQAQMSCNNAISIILFENYKHTTFFLYGRSVGCKSTTFNSFSFKGSSRASTHSSHATIGLIHPRRIENTLEQTGFEEIIVGHSSDALQYW